MTRKKLRRIRAHRDCAIFFATLGENPSAEQRRRLPKMRAIAGRTGFSARAQRASTRTNHYPRSKAFKKFRDKIAFYTERTKRAGWLSPMHFTDRPYFDLDLGKLTNCHEILDEVRGLIYLRPNGYVEHTRPDGKVFFIPVPRSHGRRHQRSPASRDRREQRRAPQRNLLLTEG